MIIITKKVSQLALKLYELRGEKTLKIITTTLLSLFAITAFANPYDYKVTRIIDGDTVAFEANFLPAPLKPELSIRVLGVDTP